MGATADPASDEELVLFAAEGDESAFAVLVKRYQRRVTAFVAQMVGDLDVARELTQETFLRAWRALGRFDRRYKFSTWLFRIAHNLAIDQLRRRRVPTTPLQARDDEGEPLEIRLPDTGRSPLEHLENSELAKRLRQVIDELRPEYRELILLRHFAGLSYQEIADLQGRPLGTIKNKLFRAHNVLRNELAEYVT
jgi:RNA polymerase sigma-70 factor (ECF subfamily)